MTRRKSKKPSIFLKLSWFILLGLVVLVVLMVGISNIMVKYEEYNEGLQLQTEKETQRDAIRLDIKKLQAKQFNFQNDYDFLTEVAHQEGMVAPGEFLVEFKDDPRRRMTR